MFSAWEGEKWDGVATVGSRPSRVSSVEQVIVETDPPQFSQ